MDYIYIRILALITEYLHKYMNKVDVKMTD